jgi:hypothetical protein
MAPPPINGSRASALVRDPFERTFQARARVVCKVQEANGVAETWIPEHDFDVKRQRRLFPRIDPHLKPAADRGRLVKIGDEAAAQAEIVQLQRCIDTRCVEWVGNAAVLTPIVC